MNIGIRLYNCVNDDIGRTRHERNLYIIWHGFVYPEIVRKVEKIVYWNFDFPIVNVFNEYIKDL